MSTTITAFFTSGSGNLASGLTPLVKVRNVTTGDLIVTGTMTEVGDGWYKFLFTQYTGSIDYAITIDGNTSSLDNRFMFAGNENFVEDIWSAQLTDNSVSGSMGAAMSVVSSSVAFVKEIEDGTWHITGSQMVFYASGTNIELARFELQDSLGSSIDPASQNPFRRVRI